MHLLLRTDSRALGLAARLMGGSVPRLADHYMGQLEMYFGGLAWYLGQDGERTRRLFARLGQPMPAWMQPVARPAPPQGAL
jgi:hypothetical protein